MPENPVPKRSGPERRRSKRIPLEGVQVQVMKVGMTERIPSSTLQPTPNIAVQLLDLSGGGLKIVSWADMNYKERVIIHLQVGALNRSFNCRGIVKWKKPFPANEKACFELGIEYIDMPSEDRILLRELEK